MKRVAIYTPKIKRSKKGREVITTIEDRKGTFVEFKNVMDRTLALFQDGTEEDVDDRIIHSGMYMEEVDKKDSKKDGFDLKSVLKEVKKHFNEMSAEDIIAEARTTGVAMGKENKKNALACILSKYNESSEAGKSNFDSIPLGELNEEVEGLGLPKDASQGFKALALAVSEAV